MALTVLMVALNIGRVGTVNNKHTYPRNYRRKYR